MGEKEGNAQGGERVTKKPICEQGENECGCWEKEV